MDIAFEVGNAETHTVALSTRSLNGQISLSDGVTAERQRFWIWIPLQRRIEVQVGDEERHVVAVDVKFAKWSRKFRKPSCSVYVDDELVGSY